METHKKNTSKFDKQLKKYAKKKAKKRKSMNNANKGKTNNYEIIYITVQAAIAPLDGSALLERKNIII